MPGSAHRSLPIHPLCRDCLLFLAVAGICVGGLFLSSAADPATVAPLLTTVANENAPDVDQAAEWPRTVLRLWFLVPQFLPGHVN